MGDRSASRVLGDTDELQSRLEQRRSLLRHELARAHEDPRHLVRRAQQLVAHPERLEPAGTEPSPDEVNAAERIINRNDLVHTNYLERGVRAVRSVVRVSLRDAAGNVAPEGTGSLVAPGLLMTNHHVLGDPGTAGRAVVDLDYELDLTGSERSARRLSLDPGTFFVADPGLDVAFVAFAEPVAPAEDPGTGPVPLLLVDDEDAITVGEHVNVVQHPRGQRKQVAFRANQVLDRLDDLLWYAADTEPGSSGAPVFNDQWVLVGLHRQSIPRREGDEVLNKDGTVHTPGQADDEIDWIANEGVRSGAIRGWLAGLDLDVTAGRWRDALLTGVLAP